MNRNREFLNLKKKRNKKKHILIFSMPNKHKINFVAYAVRLCWDKELSRCPLNATMTSGKQPKLDSIFFVLYLLVSSNQCVILHLLIKIYKWLITEQNWKKNIYSNGHLSFMSSNWARDCHTKSSCQHCLLIKQSL